MSIYKELSYNQDVETISGLQFSIMSAEEIENRSVAEIVSTDTFAGNDPIIGGLFDPRMGVIDHNKICQTCEQKNTFCPGHFGHIVLAKPLFYIQFFDVVKKLMKCICFKCSKLLLDKDQPELNKILSKRISKQKKFEFIYKLCSKNKIKRCGKDIKNNGCGAKQPDKISKDTHVGRIVLEWKTKEEEEDIEDMILFGSDVYRIFSRITDEDSNIIGFPRNINKPEDLICTVFPVPPPSVRPSVRNDTGQRCEDDLTHKLCDIVKTNNTLKTKIEKNVNKEQIDYWTILLQYHLSTFIDNKIPGIPQAKQRTGRPLRSLGERLKSKEGRIRGNLMGKRVDFSARSVITPDPRISINELGVPIKIAMNLTFPERVNKYNREKLTKLITNGPDNYPGAKYIRKANQDYRTIRIKNLDITTINLEDNDIVDRHIMNGDFILFNRQPSLHKMSMMSHKVKVMPYDTFRLNPAVTPSYNADYDGDEMNLHLPQSVQTENELKMLSNVTSQIISPRESKPIISVVQDVTLGLYRLTKDTSMLNEKQVFNLMMTNTKFKGVVPEPIYVKDDVKKWNGKQLLSEILPPNLNVVNKNNQYDESNKNNKDNLIVIEDGKIKQGVFDKKIYQDRTNGLVHILFNDNGQDEARHLFDNTQKLICDWLVYSGFSVGISDLVISKEMNDEMKKVINDMKVKVYDIIRKVHENNYENNSFDSNKQNFENDVNKLLNDARNEVGKIALKNITDDNRMINMIKSKSKGNPVNIAQMISTLGQQNVDGKRIPDGFTDRTLPHFTKYDDGPESRGFVENSFINGLTPQEFYFHAMGGREGLIDTAVKSITGDTPIIIVENDIPKKVNIGDWIDNHLKNNKKDIKYYDEKEANMELLDIENNENLKVVIPTTDNVGNMSWEKITKITRHDPSELIYIIKTKGGRKVKVVESKSLLIWNSEIDEYEPTLTTDIKIGDYVPVCCNLSNKNVKQINYINMENYLPKDEYIYGTDFNNAMKLIIEKDRKLPKFWWNNNNGTEFTLPYNNAHSLLRVEKRSNIDIIKDNYIYPYRGERSEAKIEDKLELNRENGVFLGIYLAEGNSHITSGKVMICNNNPEILSIVRQWFDKRSIKNKTYTKNIKNAISTTIQGYSVVLAKFLNKFVGKISRDKFIPSEFYLAPDDFIIGLLDGYFSGDGHITKNSIEISSASYQLIEGISMLLTRFGIFSKISLSTLKSNNFGTTNIAPINRLAIRSKFAINFSKIIQLSHPDKSKKLNNLLNSDTILKYENIYQIKKDTILDEIISIEKISSKEYPKVYDLTIPATKNFGLSNGLQVYDTSETGYLQRRLIKSMEDCKINYDLTVRNATGSIVQFLYGEDGINANKLENHSLPFIGMEPSELQETYLLKENDIIKNIFQKKVFEQTIKSKETFDRCLKHYKEILEHRHYLITEVFKCKDESRVLYPISIKRIITNAISIFHKKKTRSDLSPLEVLDDIDGLVNELYLNDNNKGNKLLEILLKTSLTPKKILLKDRLNKLSFEYVKNEIIKKFRESIAHPSEMVGVVSAQSIGEPCTQITLNTFHSAGISSASQTVRGVPRIKELLNNSKNIKGPSTKVYLNENINKDYNKCKEVLNVLETTYIKDIVKSSSIYYDKSDDVTTIGDDSEFLKLYKMYEENCNISSPWLLRFKFNKEKMYNLGVTMHDIYHTITKYYEDIIECQFSDDNSDELVFRIRLVYDEDDNKSKIDKNDIITELKALEHNIIENIIIKGIEGIKKVILLENKDMKYNSDTMKFEKNIEWYMDTNGNNLLDILIQKNVDSKRTISNNINEVLEILGIEAAREVLLNELNEVLDQEGVNFRHLSLLVDTMTNKGNILSIDRHGINRSDIGPLAKCSFEETTDMLIKAGLFGEYDKMNGVSGNIMLGQIPPCGTGDTKILIDEEKLMNINKRDIEDMEEIDGGLCNEENLEFDFEIPTVELEIEKTEIKLNIV